MLTDLEIQCDIHMPALSLIANVFNTEIDIILSNNNMLLYLAIHMTPTEIIHRPTTLFFLKWSLIQCSCKDYTN